MFILDDFYLLNFDLLHLACIGRTFSRVSGPPLDIGIQWSVVKLSGHSGFPGFLFAERSIGRLHK
jgi:hypothetical protein